MFYYSIQFLNKYKSIQSYNQIDFNNENVFYHSISFLCYYIPKSILLIYYTIPSLLFFVFTIIKRFNLYL